VKEETVSGSGICWAIRKSKLAITQQVIHVNANGPHDTASHPIDHIAMHTMTKLEVEHIHQVTAFVDVDSILLHRPTAVSF